MLEGDNKYFLEQTLLQNLVLFLFKQWFLQMRLKHSEQKVEPALQFSDLTHVVVYVENIGIYIVGNNFNIY